MAEKKAAAEQALREKHEARVVEAERDTTRKKATSSAGKMATSSAGTRATSIALQLIVSSSVGETRATTNFVSSSAG